MDKKDKLFDSDDEDDLEYHPDQNTATSQPMATPQPVPAAPQELPQSM